MCLVGVCGQREREGRWVEGCRAFHGGGTGGMVLWLRELISQEPTPMETQASEEPHPSCTLSCSTHPPPRLVLTSIQSLPLLYIYTSIYIYIYIYIYISLPSYHLATSHLRTLLLGVAPYSTPKETPVVPGTKLPRNSIANRCRCAANTSPPRDFHYPLRVTTR